MDETLRQICQELAERKEKISRKEITEFLRLLKEKEKEQKQKEYEEQITYETEMLLTFIGGQKRTELKQKVEEIMNKAQNMAFMDGYRYAITILEEGITNMK